MIYSGFGSPSHSGSGSDLFKQMTILFVLHNRAYSKFADVCFKEEFDHLKSKLLKMCKIDIKKVRVSEQYRIRIVKKAAAKSVKCEYCSSRVVKNQFSTPNHFQL